MSQVANKHILFSEYKLHIHVPELNDTYRKQNMKWSNLKKTSIYLKYESERKVLLNFIVVAKHPWNIHFNTVKGK